MIFDIWLGIMSVVAPILACLSILHEFLKRWIGLGSCMSLSTVLLN